MQEQKLIEVFSRIHSTRPFGADAEVVPFEGTNLLVSTDSFSEREDFLSDFLAFMVRGLLGRMRRSFHLKERICSSRRIPFPIARIFSLPLSRRPWEG